MCPTGNKASRTTFKWLLSFLLSTSTIAFTSGCGDSSNSGTQSNVSQKSVPQSSTMQNNVSSNNNPLNQPLDVSSLSQSDEWFINYLQQSFFPSIDQEASRVNQIVSDFDQQSQLTDQERRGYADALAGAVNEIGVFADLSDHSGGNLGSNWLGTDNPNLSNAELKTFALAIRANLKDLESNCAKLSSMLTSNRDSSDMNSTYTNIANDLNQLEQYEADLNQCLGN